MPPTAPFSSVSLRLEICGATAVEFFISNKPGMFSAKEGVIDGETVDQTFISTTQLVTQLIAPGFIAASEAFVHGL